MKKIVTMLLFISVAFAGYSSSKYTIDDSKVETILEQSTAVEFNFTNENPLNVTSIQASQNPWIAVALGFFLGGFGVHRVYLGTPPGIIAGYFFTCGGIFGILPIIDIIVLVINNEDISAYVDKKGLIMFN
ncbi:MAG: TM2 domain-containing membrane protein YozV [Cyclobacteriaceae bacterium]|jgi:TM2 domain-containing membrane protein YozV